MSCQNSFWVAAIAFSSTLTVTMAAILPAAAQSQTSEISTDLPIETTEDTSVGVEALSVDSSTEVEQTEDTVLEPLTATLDGIESDDQVIQQAAANALIETGEAAVPELTAALVADSAETRAIAAYTLSEIGTGAEAAMPALLNSLGDEDELVRALATSALVNVGLDQSTLINLLVAAIRDEPGLVKDIAADALVQMGSSAVPALSDLLADEAVSTVAKQSAATVISDIGLSTAVSEAVLQVAVPTLSAALSQDNAVTQLYAADALWTLTEDRDLVLPTLVTVAASSDHKARDLAALGLAHLGRQILPAVPLLNRVISNPEPSSRNIVQTALGVAVNSSPVSALGIIARESPRLLRRVPAIVRAVTRLWR